MKSDLISECIVCKSAFLSREPISGRIRSACPFCGSMKFVRLELNPNVEEARKLLRHAAACYAAAVLTFGAADPSQAEKLRATCDATEEQLINCARFLVAAEIEEKKRALKTKEEGQC